MKKIFLLALASVLTIGSMAEKGKKHSSKKQKNATTSTQVCPPACKVKTTCPMMSSNKS